MSRLHRAIFIALLLGLSIQPLFAQETIIKEIIEPVQERKFAFYASTLRMLNLSKNEEYNQLVSGVEKLLVYTLDSGAQASKSYRKLSSAYLEAGFEEYAMAMGGGMDMAVMGKEGSSYNELAGFVSVEANRTIAFYLRGDIDWAVIPGILSKIKTKEFINVLDLKQ